MVFFINKRNIIDIGIYIQREIIYFTTQLATQKSLHCYILETNQINGIKIHAYMRVIMFAIFYHCSSQIFTKLYVICK